MITLSKPLCCAARLWNTMRDKRVSFWSFPESSRRVISSSLIISLLHALSCGYSDVARQRGERINAVQAPQCGLDLRWSAVRRCLRRQKERIFGPLIITFVLVLGLWRRPRTDRCEESRHPGSNHHPAGPQRSTGVVHVREAPLLVGLLLVLLLTLRSFVRVGLDG